VIEFTEIRFPVRIEQMLVRLGVKPRPLDRTICLNISTLRRMYVCDFANVGRGAKHQVRNCEICPIKDASMRGELSYTNDEKVVSKLDDNPIQHLWTYCH